MKILGDCFEMCILQTVCCPFILLVILGSFAEVVCLLCWILWVLIILIMTVRVHCIFHFDLRVWVDLKVLFCMKILGDCLRRWLQYLVWLFWKVHSAILICVRLSRFEIFILYKIFGWLFLEATVIIYYDCFERCIVPLSRRILAGGYYQKWYLVNCHRYCYKIWFTRFHVYEQKNPKYPRY